MHVPARRSLTERMQGAALLDVPTYEEVERDTGATGQAAIVVGLVAVATAIGTLNLGLGHALSSLVGAYVGWLLWSLVTYLIGDKLLGGTATWGELMRTLGFAQSPGVLNIFGIIPFLGGIVRFAVAIWILIAGIVAIRQACDFGTGKAVLTAVLGWIVYMVLTALLWMFGVGIGM